MSTMRDGMHLSVRRMPIRRQQVPFRRTGMMLYGEETDQSDENGDDTSHFHYGYAHNSVSNTGRGSMATAWNPRPITKSKEPAQKCQCFNGYDRPPSSGSRVPDLEWTVSFANYDWKDGSYLLDPVQQVTPRHGDTFGATENGSSSGNKTVSIHRESCTDLQAPSQEVKSPYPSLPHTKERERRPYARSLYICPWCQKYMKRIIIQIKLADLGQSQCYELMTRCIVLPRQDSVLTMPGSTKRKKASKNDPSSLAPPYLSVDGRSCLPEEPTASQNNFWDDAFCISFRKKWVTVNPGQGQDTFKGLEGRYLRVTPMFPLRVYGLRSVGYLSGWSLVEMLSSGDEYDEYDLEDGLEDEGGLGTRETPKDTSSLMDQIVEDDSEEEFQRASQSLLDYHLKRRRGY
jgi:hypothetical protein